MSVLAYVILLHKNFKRECRKINKIRSKLNLLKKFAYKNNSTCVCVVCVLLSVAWSWRDHSRSLKKQLAEDLLNSRPGSFFSFSLIFFFFLADEKDQPGSAEVSNHDIPNILKQIYFQIVIAIWFILKLKLKGLFHKVEGCISLILKSTKTFWTLWCNKESVTMALEVRQRRTSFAYSETMRNVIVLG